jgi:hypothetical protein
MIIKCTDCEYGIGADSYWFDMGVMKVNLILVINKYKVR